MSEVSTPKRRTGTPKARTGCQNCKSRHIKCDEARPACLRCQVAKIPCLGYLIPARKKRNQSDITRSSSVESRPLRPKALPTRRSTLDVDIRRCSPSESRVIALPTQVASPWSFRSARSKGCAEGDGIYLDFFRHQVINNPIGYYTTSMWSRLVSREVFPEDCVEHSVLAIGALMQSGSNTIDDRHHQAALMHHVKAAALLRRNISTLRSTCPDVLIETTLLLVVFELRQGKLGAAHALLASCISLLYEGHKDVQKGDIEVRPSITSYGDMEWILLTVAGISNLTYHFWPPSEHQEFFQARFELQAPEPTACTSLSDLFVLFGRLFTASILFLQDCLCALLSQIATEEELMSRNPRRTMLLAHLHMWETSLKGLSHVLDSAGTQSHPLQLIRVHWLYLYITLNCCLDPTQISYDLFEEEFRQLTAESARMMSNASSHAGPAALLLGRGLMLPLSAAIRFCRNRAIRMAAVQAIREAPASMVAWDTRALIGGLTGVITLEELGRDHNGYIPLESRWHLVSDELHAGRVYRRLTPDANGEAVYVRVDDDDEVRLDGIHMVM